MTDTPSLAWPAVCGRRLARHGLASPVGPDQLVEQVGAMCGAHAQVMAAAELSIGLRVAGVTREDVRRALWEDRTLVKTCGPRGTLHLLPARDLPRWTGALSSAPAPNRQAPAVRLTDDQTDEVVAAIGDALADADAGCTVEELGEVVIERTGPWAGERVLPAFQENRPRWEQAMQVAAFRGAVCFGPNRGRRVTYTNPSRWLPGFAPMDAAQAAAWVIRSYLHAYGPATASNVAQWLAVPRPWVTRILDAMAGEVEPVVLEGTEAWVIAGDADAGDSARGVRLLPYFDAYAVGCHPRSLVFPDRAAERALTNGRQAGTVPVLLVDGVVAGVWHQRRSGRRMAVTVEPFGRLTARQRRELDDQIDRIGEVLQTTPELTIGPVTAGAHL